MNVKTFLRTRKNVGHWAAYIKKLEAREDPPLTADELDDIEGRKAQVTVWLRELRNAEAKGLDDSDDIPGEISATSGVATSESAGADAGAEA